MEPVKIPARSKRQAMDWSLVLASQEIETTITDEENWALLVAENDHQRALAAIELYEKENRGWNWRQRLPGTGLVFHWGCFAPCFLLIVFHALSETRIPSLKQLGMMNSEAVAAGEWWRLFTAICLHGDASHLIANVTTGFLLFGMAMARYGAGSALLSTFLAGAIGNLAGYILYLETHRGLGASGMVMGALGLLAVEGIAAWRTTRATHWIRRSIAAGILVLVLVGFSEGVDIIAHVGGFVAGAGLGTILHLLPQPTRGKFANAICLFLLTGLTMTTWWLALKS